MGDVLAQGSEQPRRRRWWVLGCAVAAGVALVVYLIGRGQEPEPATAPPSPPSGSASASGTPPQPTVPAQKPWPTEVGACGSTATLPLLATGRISEPTGLTLLVGGAGLRVVTVDTGAVRPVSGNRGQTTGLASSATGVHALQFTCDSVQSAAGKILAVDVAHHRAAAVSGRPADVLLAAPDSTWATAYPSDLARPMVLQRLGGTARIIAPLGLDVVAVTSRELVGGLFPPGEQSDAGNVALVAVSRDDTSMVRGLGRGQVLAANEEFVLWGEGCSGTSRCVLVRTGKVARRYPLPRGRTPTSAAVLSHDGRYVAFQLSRTDLEPEFDPGHPGPPNDIAVQDLHTGKLLLVPGVELAPKSSAGLTFSRDGRWLVIALNEGRRTRLLLWRTGLDRPLEVPVRLPGAVMYDVPVLDVSDRT